MPHLYGIGYEGQTLKRFIQNLKNHKTTVLVDVRLNPISRKKASPRQNFRRFLVSMVSGTYIYVS